MATADNDNAITSVNSTAAWGTISHSSWNRSATGATTYGAATALTTNVTPAIGQAVRFAAGVLTMQVVNGELTPYGGRAAVIGIIGSGSGDTNYLGLHTGAPGTGLADEVTGGNYARLSETADNFTLADTLLLNGMARYLGVDLGHLEELANAGKLVLPSRHEMPPPAPWMRIRGADEPTLKKGELRMIGYRPLPKGPLQAFRHPEFDRWEIPDHPAMYELILRIAKPAK